jgi:hypothetical protein
MKLGAVAIFLLLLSSPLVRAESSNANSPTSKEDSSCCADASCSAETSAAAKKQNSSAKESNSAKKAESASEKKEH